jgi:hypothetical protein
MQPVPLSPARRWSVAGTARARNAGSDAVTFFRIERARGGVAAGIRGTGDKRSDEALHFGAVARVAVQARLVGDEHELVVGGDACAIDGDNCWSEAAQLELDAFDVAIDAEDGVHSVGKKRGKEAVADSNDLHVFGPETDRGQGGVERCVVGRDAGDSDRPSLQVAQ